MRRFFKLLHDLWMVKFYATNLDITIMDAMTRKLTITIKKRKIYVWRVPSRKHDVNATASFLHFSERSQVSSPAMINKQLYLQ